MAQTGISDDELLKIMKNFETCVRRQAEGDLTMLSQIIGELIAAKRANPGLALRVARICNQQTSLNHEQIAILTAGLD
jgi:hypothetical protein